MHRTGPAAWDNRRVTVPTPPLAGRAGEVLAFERAWWADGLDKDAAIRRRFGLDAVEYQRALLAIIDSPEALEHDGALVRRLRRQREARRRERVERRAD